MPTVYRGNGNENDGITAVAVMNIYWSVKISIFKNYDHWMLFKMILKRHSVDISGQFWNFDIANNIDHVGITIISGFYSNTISSVLMRSQTTGRGGNGETSPRGRAVMGRQVRGAGR